MGLWTCRTLKTVIGEKSFVRSLVDFVLYFLIYIYILYNYIAAIRLDDVHYPRTRLVALENTHNKTGGTPLTAEYMNKVNKPIPKTCGCFLTIYPHQRSAKRPYTSLIRSLPCIRGQVGELCKEEGLILHVDGARLMNAAVALDTPARELVDSADSVRYGNSSIIK